MKFDELDARMRIFETAHDHSVLPGIFVVARIDGRNFTRLTKERHKFEAPYDVRFRDMMVATTMHVMDCGFRAVYGYTQSDEISVLLHRDDDTFGRKLRKLDSVLAGEASARFTRELGDVACFDCRVSQLPTVKDVVDYFRWRNEDAHRNALNAHCYWQLRSAGDSVAAATSALEGMSVAEKNELLFRRGINFNELPLWQRRGIGVAWETYEKAGENPKTGERTMSRRRRLVPLMELPMKDEYTDFMRGIVEASVM